MWSLVSVVLLGVNRVFKTQFALGPLGCRSNPLKMDWGDARTQYLSRLRGPTGQKVFYKRLGSLPLPCPYGHLVDVYLVGVGAGQFKRLYVDTCFAGYQEKRAPFGLTLSEAQA